MTFDSIVERLKETIDTKESGKKIYNKELAKLLNLTPEYFAVIKKRKKIPYEAIAYFCKERNISINWVLFEQKPKRLSQY